jgi:hypothetical protein
LGWSKNSGAANIMVPKIEFLSRNLMGGRYSEIANVILDLRDLSLSHNLQ